MDDSDRGQIGAHGFIQEAVQDADGFYGVHSPEVNFRWHGGGFHFPSRVGRAGLLYLEFIGVLQQIDLLWSGCQLQDSRL